MAGRARRPSLLRAVDGWYKTRAKASVRSWLEPHFRLFLECSRNSRLSDMRFPAHLERVMRSIFFVLAALSPCLIYPRPRPTTFRAWVTTALYIAPAFHRERRPNGGARASCPVSLTTSTANRASLRSPSSSTRRTFLPSPRRLGEPAHTRRSRCSMFILATRGVESRSRPTPSHEALSHLCSLVP